MKTLDEIYAKVSASEELMAKYLSLQSAEEQVAFVKGLGGDTTAEELAAFLDKKSRKTGELTDTDLEQVVGGKGGSSAARVCPSCGSRHVSRYEKKTGYVYDVCSCKDCGKVWVAY